MIGHLYRIPLIKRYIDVSKPPGSSSKMICMDIRGIGVFIYYRKHTDLNIVDIARTLVCNTDTKCIVEADTPQEAVLKFYNEWEGAKVGGNTPDSKALWIDKKRNILQYPFCKLLHRNSRNELTCGEPAEFYNYSGEYGMCTLEGYDSPDDCPVADFCNLVCKSEESIEIKTMVEGFSVIRPSDFKGIGF